MFTSQYNALKASFDKLANDVAKADKGNHAAKTRIRVALQQVKKDAQALRVALAPHETPAG